MRKNETEGITLNDFKTYFIAIVIEIVWYWQMDRYKD